MTIERITSRRNPVVARFREAAQQPGTSILLDGEHVVSTALEAGLRIELAAVQLAGGPADRALQPSCLDRLLAHGARVVSVSSAVMDALSPMPSPPGIVALAERPRCAPERLLEPAPALVLVAVAVQDPGNVGAIVRAADAAGATGVIATAGSADPFGWKAVRGSMGSVLRLPIWSGVLWPEVEHLLRSRRVNVVAAVPGGSPSLYHLAWRRPTAVLLGSEGSGLPGDVVGSADGVVGIPMREGVESLNVAVTAALIAYEARRVRLRAVAVSAPTPREAMARQPAVTED